MVSVSCSAMLEFLFEAIEQQHQFCLVRCAFFEINEAPDQSEQDACFVIGQILA
jgi:hypothetical protein